MNKYVIEKKSRKTSNYRFFLFFHEMHLKNNCRVYTKIAKYVPICRKKSGFQVWKPNFTWYLMISQKLLMNNIYYSKKWHIIKLTPGHFLYQCGYNIDKKIQNIQANSLHKQNSFIEKILLIQHILKLKQ